ncbi:MAG: endonuclease/exonuclease/phosphatase family protein [Bacteriovoracaceae bacterium]
MRFFINTIIFNLLVIYSYNLFALELKVVTYNIRQDLDHWSERVGPLTSEILQVDPDIIFLQEVKVSKNQIEQIINEMDAIDPSKKHTYYTYQDVKPGLFKLSGEGLAILSKFPLSDFEYITLDSILGRFALKAQVTIDDKTKIDLYNLHLDFMWNGFRNAEIKRLFKTINEKPDKGNSIILGGDFNSIPTSYVVKKVLENNFKDSYELFNGNQTENLGKTISVDTKKFGIPIEKSLKQRIDYLFFNENNSSKLFQVTDAYTIGFQEISRGLHPSDHLGIFIKLNIN